MSVTEVTAKRVDCDKVGDDERRCPAVLFMSAALTAEQVAAAARERGWSTQGGDLCPSHR